MMISQNVTRCQPDHLRNVGESKLGTAAMPYVSRINQVDAWQLDKEIYNIFHRQSSEILKFCTPGQVGKWQPEINALLKIAIWTSTLRSGNSTWGQQLLNLHYEKLNEKKAIFYVILTVVPKYIRERVITHTGVNRSIKRYADWIETSVQLLSFVNILLFLNRGHQPNVIERILGIYHQPTIANKPRNIGYTYMTRELLWHSFIELFTTGLPMLNLHFIKQRIKRLWSTRKKLDVLVLPKMEIDTRCAECDLSPNLPRHAGCEHIFCYYCMKARFTADSTFDCPVCGAELHSSRMKTL